MCDIDSFAQRDGGCGCGCGVHTEGHLSVEDGCRWETRQDDVEEEEEHYTGERKDKEGKKRPVCGNSQYFIDTYFTYRRRIGKVNALVRAAPRTSTRDKLINWKEREGEGMREREREKECTRFPTNTGKRVHEESVW